MRPQRKQQPSDREFELEVELESPPSPAPPSTAGRRGPMRVEPRENAGVARRRVTPRMPDLDEELEALEKEGDVEGSAPPATGASGSHYGKQHDRVLPQFSPNKILNLLTSVSEGTDAGKIERRVFRLALVSAIILLVGTVLSVVGMTFYFRANSIQAELSAQPSRTPLAVTPATIDPALLLKKITDAQAVLTAFFETTEVANKRGLVLDGERQSELMLRHYGLNGGREAGQPLFAQSKALQTGASITLLVPVESSDGDIRTAAAIESPNGFRIDWRSVVTPETLGWDEFLRTKPAQAQLFRVRLSAANDLSKAGKYADASAWRCYRLERSGAGAVLGAIPAGSRAATELDGVLAGAHGKPVGADLYLSIEPGAETEGAVRIAGWVPEKWTL